jgi:hypothetical protein
MTNNLENNHHRSTISACWVAQPHPPDVFELELTRSPSTSVEAHPATMSLLLDANGRSEAWPVSREDFEKTLTP